MHTPTAPTADAARGPARPGLVTVTSPGTTRAGVWAAALNYFPTDDYAAAGAELAARGPGAVLWHGGYADVIAERAVELDHFVTAADPAEGYLDGVERRLRARGVLS